MALAEGGDKEIVVSIIVVVANRHAHPEHGNGQPGLASDVSERAVMIVVIELQRGGSLGVSGPVFAVDQQDVGVAVIVVVDEAAPGPNVSGKPLFAEGRVVVHEADSGLGRNVAELRVLRNG